MKQPSRTHRRTTAITAVGLVLLFVCCFALPEALVSLSQASAQRGGQPLTERGWVMVVVGFGTLAVGGVLSIVGIVLRRTAAPQPLEEDELLAEQYGEGSVVNEYDPLQLNPNFKVREERRERR
ncbi:hypothetical protein [Kocuria sp.]|uniref:hypothetical protein n=1 Tax=Kocuria sp. TaxID=1871328 RepID=UPI0026DDC70D|nr:hypothetical protein [Kocuria sp.]MDO4918596.1 hypothetical protein [Kocuria sp.]